jgi:predicted short-subunit dehydrogenase-like oxidoreductase (DUF2520 family)
MKDSPENIVIIGSGNMAYHLARVFLAANRKILQIFGRNSETTKSLGEHFQVPYSIKRVDLRKDAGLYFLAVNDDSLKDIATSLRLGESLVVHTSGSESIEVLKPVSLNYGVFYPVQTLSSAIDTDFAHVPICLEANSEKNYSKLESLASVVSGDVRKVSSSSRLIIHLAAVFANNFSNHMFAIADSILAKHEISPDILRSLIIETVEKLKVDSPGVLQTGPASRNDQDVIQKHLHLLEKMPEYRELYILITESIRNQKNKRS